MGKVQCVGGPRFDAKRGNMTFVFCEIGHTLRVMGSEVRRMVGLDCWNLLSWVTLRGFTAVSE